MRLIEFGTLASIHQVTMPIKRKRFRGLFISLLFATYFFLFFYSTGFESSFGYPPPLPPDKQLTKFESVLFETIRVDQSSFASRHWVDRIIKDYLDEEEIIKRTKNCKSYFQDHIIPVAKLVNSTLETVPLGFSTTVHLQIGIFELQMAAIYRPQNSHCIYIDRKASEKVFSAVHGIVNCYKEEFLQNCTNCGSITIVENTFPLYWGHISILEADLICMETLLNDNKDWKFYLNSAGTELPVHPTEVLSNTLKILDESIIESYVLPTNENARLTEEFALQRSGFKSFEYSWLATGRKRSPPPYNVTIMKGSRYVIVKRDLAEFLVRDPIAKKLYNWVVDMPNGDESYFSTLVRVNVDGGSVTQNLEFDSSHGQCARLIHWNDRKCSGKHIRDVCNFGVGDLPILRNSHCFIANKFNLNVSPSAAMLHWFHIANKSTPTLRRKFASHGL